MNFQKYIILGLFVFSYECMAITRVQKRFEKNLERLAEEDLWQRLQFTEAALAQAQKENNTLKKISIDGQLELCCKLKDLLEKLNDYPQSGSSFQRVDAAKRALDFIEHQIKELNSTLT